MEEKKGSLTENYRSLWKVIASKEMEFVGEEQINSCLVTLTPREEYILRWAFGLESDGKKLTSKEIGENFMMTPKKIEEVKEKALKKLRDRLSVAETNLEI